LRHGVEKLIETSQGHWTSQSKSRTEYLISKDNIIVFY